MILFCTLLVFRINTWFLYSDLGLLQTLTDMLCKELGKDDVKLNSKVLSLSYSCDGKSALENWSVSYASDQHKHLQGLSVDAVIMTVSIHIFLETFFFFLIYLQDHGICIFNILKKNVWFICLMLLLLKLMQLDVSWLERNKTRINEIEQERKYIYSTWQFLDSCQLPWHNLIKESCFSRKNPCHRAR